MPRRRPLLAAAAATVGTIAVAGALWLSASPAAYAVSAADNGDVTVTVTRLEDTEGLTAALAAHGIRAAVDYLPAGKTCAPGRYLEAHPSGQFQVGIGARGGQPGFSISVPKAGWDPSWTLVLSHSGDLTAMTGSVGVATGAVAPCQQVDGPPFPDGGGDQVPSGGAPQSSVVNN